MKCVNAAARGSHEAFRVYVHVMDGGAPPDWDNISPEARDGARRSAERVMVGEEPTVSLFEEIVMTLAAHMGVLDEAEVAPKPKTAFTTFLDVVFKSVGKGIAEYAAEQGVQVPGEPPPADPELEKTIAELQEIGEKLHRGEVREEWVALRVAELRQKHGHEHYNALNDLFQNAVRTGERGSR